MKKYVAFVAIAAVALVVVAMPALAITGVSGTATTDNTILGVKVGSTVVKIGTDAADSLNTSTLKAVGRFITGQIGPVSLGSPIEKTATSASDSGSKPIGSGITKNFGPLGSVKLQGGKVAAAISSTKVHSSVDFALANLNALGGFTNIGTTSSSTDSVVGTNSSTVSRDVSIGKVDVLDLRTLLSQLGIDPLALACAAVEDTGASLNVDTSAACATLTSITNSLGVSVPTEVNGTETAFGVLELALAPLCAAAPAGTCDTVNTQIASLHTAIDNFQADPATTCASMDDAIATIGGAADTVVTTLNGLSGGALPDLTAILAPVTTQLGALDTALATLDSTCTTLLGLVDSILDTPILSLDLVKVTMDLAAKVNPTAVAAGSIGTLKVGNVSVVNSDDLVALGAKLNQAIDDVESAVGGVLSATGLGLGAPSLDLLKVTQDAGKTASGSYFATASMSVVHLGIPSASVSLPSTNPLGALSGLGTLGAASVHVAAVTTPAVSVDAGVFGGNATYKAAPKNTGALATTGVSDSGLAFAGMLTLIGAALIRRTTRVN